MASPDDRKARPAAAGMFGSAAAPLVTSIVATEFGNNFLSNTWRVPSESDWQHALLRTSEGFGGRALSNAFNEFVPLVWRKVRHQPDPYPADLQRP